MVRRRTSNEIVEQRPREEDEKYDKFPIPHGLRPLYCRQGCFSRSQGPHSYLLQVPNLRISNSALKEDPAFMKRVANCYTKGSYKNVRCLGAPILPSPVAINLSNIQKFSARNLHLSLPSHRISSALN